MKAFLHNSVFKYNVNIRPISQKEISTASLVDLTHLIPFIDARNEDLMPFASNVFVANKANENDDIVDTLTTLSFYELFKYKYVNAEHQKGNILGVVLDVGFTEFGTDKFLSKDEVIALGNSPFNVAVGGVIWTLSKPGVAEYIQETSDPSSNEYLSLGSSWEIGFDKFEIAISKNGGVNITDCEIISDLDEVKRLTPYLRKYKGAGTLPDGRRVFRKPLPEVLPYGIGITGQPAADVIGVATNKTLEVVLETQPPIAVADASKDSSKISQPNESVVTINENNNCMEIKTIEDIASKWKEIANASVVTEFIASEMKKANEKWQEEVNQTKNALESAQAAREAAEKRSKEVEVALAEIQTKLGAFEQAEKDRQLVATFNSRMDEINLAYKLDDELSKVVANQIKAIASDEDFGKWKEQASVLMKAYAKKACKGKGQQCDCEECKKEIEMEDAKKKACAKAAAEKADAEAKAAEEAKAKETAAAALENALENGEQGKSTIPNAGNPNEETFREKFAKHFTLKEGFEFNFKNRRV